MRERTWWLACALIVLSGAALPGCGDDDAGGTPDAGPETAPLSGDWSCLDTRTAPAGGAETTFSALLYVFNTQPPEGVPNLEVEIFRDNEVTATCGAGCQRYTTDAAGMIPGLVGDEGSWFAYRAARGGGGATAPFATVGYNRVVPGSGGVAEIPSISNMTVGFIPQLYLRERLPGTAIISGTLNDCAGQPVENADVRVFRGGEELVPGEGVLDFFTGYFNERSLPDLNRTETNTNGLFAAANAPAGDEPVRVELWGRPGEDQPRRRVACEEARLFADTVTTVTMGPLRADYAAGSGCR